MARSLHPQTTYCIPEETARVAHAAFPKGNLYLRIADELGVIDTDHQCADLFPRRGQPALSPVRLAVATILQFAEGLSDRQTADAVRGRIDWKYLRCLDLTNAGVDHSVLSEFRARVRAGNPETLLLDTLLTQLQERRLLEARGKQRTDRTRVLAAVRMLNRRERVGQTLRAARNAVATVVPAWIPADWIERYGPRVDTYHLGPAFLRRFAC
ncbi:transposase [Herpetosiphon giganteus]|uniref:transposase n=1 Tax=Herpetosiphon giganteus TaxID=2029754 RepID=UPI00195AB4DE|nr:transposase [Herpetosiphon giganteus]MBM7845725.1 transposase [Herpetosiphon giganteus]